MKEIAIITRGGASEATHLGLVVDGRLIEHARVWGDPKFRIVEVADEAAARRIASLPTSKVPRAVAYLSLNLQLFEWPSFHGKILFAPREGTLSFEFSPDVLAWSGPWSIGDYSLAVADAIGEMNREDAVADVSAEGRFELRTRMVANSILDAVGIWLPVLRELREAVERRLIEQNGAIILRFDFPPAVKIACEQYLVYFAEFLRDLDVPARTEIREDAGTILFSVSPENSQQALSKIYTALQIYLDLPRHQLSEAYDIAAQKLAANVLFLRSQLTLAQATLQAQRKTIEAQDLALAMQQRLQEPRSIASPAPITEREAFLGGIVTIKPYEGKGFEIDLPNLFRKLKRLLKN